MKKKSGSNILIRNTGKIDFTFFNFPVLTSSILEMFANSDRYRTTIPRAGADLLPVEKKDLPTDKILNLQRKPYLKAKVQLAYDTFAKYPMSMSGIMSSNKKRSHGKPD